MTHIKSTKSGTSRRGFLAVLGSATLLSVAPNFATTGFAKAPAILTGAGNYRSLALANDRTGEWLKSVYWIEGEYIPEALAAYNHILRDWREDRAVTFDPRTLDILTAVQTMLETSEPFEIVSGYRTPATNAMLRSHSGAVASNSYHMRAMAIDLRMQSRSVNQIGRAGMALGAGGVGLYNRSNFVHLDSGPQRDWGR